MREEVFGPVLAIVKIHSDDEAVALANDCDFGLGSNVFGSRKRALRVGAKLNAGRPPPTPRARTPPRSVCSSAV